MLDNRQFWILTAIGVLAVILAVANMAMFQDNRRLQAEANDRAQYIQQSVQLETLYRQIVEELGQRALRTRDDQVRDLLIQQGFNINFDARPGDGGTAP